MKNYIGFVNDHSGSMSGLANAAKVDYNANIAAVKDAASREMLDTVVSVVGIGLSGGGYGVQRQVVISNPHVLKEIKDWPTPGGTPLYDGVGDMINLFKSLPDYNSPDVSFLVITTTDGHEMHSKAWTASTLAREIKTLQATGRWTFAFRVPKGSKSTLSVLGIPLDNIQEWGTTEAGMRESTAATTQAINSFYSTRSAGAKSSTVFYANAANVNTQTVKANLVDVSKEVSLYVVPAVDQGIEIRPFILRHRMEYLKGAAFYQLTKTESKVSETKLIAIRDRSTGAVYSGQAARDLIGLPAQGNARLHPGDHGNYDIFIQSESVNRKLVAGTGVLYWAKIGKQFTDADLAYLNRPAVVAKPAVVVLPAVTPTNKPTPSPIPVTPKGPMVNGRAVTYYTTRSIARASGKPVQDAVDYAGAAHQGRWFTFN